MLTGIKDLDYKILNQLDDKELVNYCQTHKEANQICSDQTFWMNRILTKFPYLSIEILRKYKGDRTWSEYYINDLRRINPLNAQNFLYNASESGRLDQVMIAVNNGADILDNNNIPVIWASRTGHLETVKYLVSLGADIRARNDVALRVASEGGHLEVVQYLVSLGADIRVVDDYALRYASRNGHLEIVQYLTLQGADIRARNDEAVRWASERGHLDIVDYLVSLGAPDPRV